MVKMIHFENALKEVIPAFGLDQVRKIALCEIFVLKFLFSKGEFDNLRGNIIPFSKDFQKMMITLKQFVSQGL